MSDDSAPRSGSLLPSPAFLRRSFFSRAFTRPGVTEAAAKRHLDEVAREHRRQLDAIEAANADTRAKAEHAFLHEVRQLRAAVDEKIENAPHLYGPWRRIESSAVDWDRLGTETVIPSYVRVGSTSWTPDGIDAPTVDALDVPALVPVRRSPGLLLKTDAEGTATAGRLAQSVALRMLLALQPGKARFTLIDPVGLGRNVAGLLHLADHDLKLITGKVWTQTQHIEQRLLDLTEDMERVILRIRNKYPNLEEYNAQAGALSEPYRVLMVFDFPVGFREDAARSLASIVQNGPLYGVFPIVVWNQNETAAYGVTPEEFERTMTVLDVRKDGSARMPSAASDPERPKVDDVPEEATYTRLVDRVGSLARAAEGVVIPFEHISPPLNAPESWWQTTSESGLHAPLGRMGVEKVRTLDLGSGTAQHALVAGKTGSGKSTLLHTAILNLALRYSPEELELYLIDFKKGVEFKAYADHRLPHARVIAIESEREFGLSVLQGLRAELARRGARFRAAGVDQMAAYREKTGERLPRVVLLVDEFQVLFAEDDVMSSEISLILDEIVRQGRAFGVHVILSSQTLRGIRHLSSSTVEQIGIRIALQCSADDSRLILAEDNPAARNITRPGEAVYNGMNGSLEGNDFFQVAFLTDEDRHRYLEAIRQRWDEVASSETRELLVFEGNAPADLSSVDPLVHAPSSLGAGQVATPHALLGEPLKMKDLTRVSLPRQSGRNCAFIGQNASLATGAFASALATIALTSPVGSALFFVCDLMPPDPSDAFDLAGLVDAIPHPTEYGRLRELMQMIETLDEELGRRKAEDATKMNAYLFVFGLHRARDLQRHGYETNEALEAFTRILQEGPEWGIHSLFWCDSFSSLERRFGSQLLKDVDVRVAMQMSNNDSHQVVDSIDAHRLGASTAILYDVESGATEKFRPFAPPSREWLARFRTAFANEAPRLEGGRAEGM